MSEPQAGERVQEVPAAYAAPARRRARARVGEQRVMLPDIEWKTYERLLHDLREHRGCRLAYYKGTLEIMAPHAGHEDVNVTLGLLVFELALALDIRSKGFGMTTFRSEARKSGFEADASFFFGANVSKVLGMKKFDPTLYPPPDLVIEIDISRTSMRKLPIYRALKVPEFWIWRGSKLKIFTLTESGYLPAETSAYFGRLPLKKELPRFVKMASKADTAETIRAFRAWLSEQLKTQ